MRTAIFFASLAALAPAFAAEAPKTIAVLEKLIPLNSAVNTLAGTTPKGEACALVAIRRNRMMNVHWNNGTVDLLFQRAGKTLHALALKSELKAAGEAYEYEFDFKLRSDSEAEFFASEGHMTNQYIGLNAYTLGLKRTSPTELNVHLEFFWADDDGMSGGYTESCLIKL